MQFWEHLLLGPVVDGIWTVDLFFKSNQLLEASRTDCQSEEEGIGS